MVDLFIFWGSGRDLVGGRNRKNLCVQNVFRHRFSRRHLIFSTLFVSNSRAALSAVSP